MTKWTYYHLSRGALFAAVALFLLHCNHRGVLTFDRLTSGAMYLNGTSFISNGVSMHVEKFKSEGGPIPGVVTVGSGYAPGAGNEIHVQNANVSFDFNCPLQEVKLSFSDYGGSVNMKLNGDWRAAKSFWAFHGLLFRGVTVTVTGRDARGILILRGKIKELLVGGRDLWINEIAYVRR